MYKIRSSSRSRHIDGGRRGRSPRESAQLLPKSAFGHRPACRPMGIVSGNAQPEESDKGMGQSSFVLAEAVTRDAAS